MKRFGLALIALGATVLVMPVSQSHAATMKECAAQWQQMKAANTTGGKTYKEFSKDCMAGGASAAAPATTTTAAKPATSGAAAPTATAAKPAAPATTSTGKPMTAGQQAMVTRERACGAEWKSAKAAGTVPAGMKWPQFWSECDKRKKAAGM